jgi:hypothetical protein
MNKNVNMGIKANMQVVMDMDILEIKELLLDI